MRGIERSGQLLRQDDEFTIAGCGYQQALGQALPRMTLVAAAGVRLISESIAAMDARRPDVPSGSSQ
jgi:hypothetical protein